MINFVKINSFYDAETIRNLFITKSYMAKGRFQIGEFYFTVNESTKSYMILIEDLDKRNIANLSYSKHWFNINIMPIIYNIVNNINL